MGRGVMLPTKMHQMIGLSYIIKDETTACTRESVVQLSGAHTTSGPHIISDFQHRFAPGHSGLPRL